MGHKMRAYAFGWLGLLLLRTAVLLAQDPQQDFEVFFAKFKLAVAQKDEAKLTTLMMPEFNFIRAQGVSPSDVFQGLEADGGRQWTNLQHAVQGKPSPYRVHGSNSPTRVMQCTPTEPIYRCLVIFQKDTYHSWRWKGMIMPTR